MVQKMLRTSALLCTKVYLEFLLFCCILIKTYIVKLSTLVMLRPYLRNPSANNFKTIRNPFLFYCLMFLVVLRWFVFYAFMLIWKRNEIVYIFKSDSVLPFVFTCRINNHGICLFIDHFITELQPQNPPQTLASRHF